MEIGEEIIETKNYEISEDIAEEIMKIGSYLRFFRLAKNWNDVERSMNHVKKTEVVWDGVDTFMMRRLTFLYLLKDYVQIKDDVMPLRTAIYRMNKSLPPKTVRPTISGSQAYRLFSNICLEDVYNHDEIEECLNYHSLPYDIAKRQIHMLPSSFPFVRSNVVYEIPNCVEWDINGAHAYELSRVFPKAEGRIKDLYSRRHENPIYKSIPNYYVGMLVRRNHRGTYNWVVQNVSEMVISKIDEETKRGGFPVYVNTDGIIMAYPDGINIPEGSKELGEWKKEESGVCRFVLAKGDSNYWAMEIGSEIKGSVSLVARKKMDLANGIIPNYVRFQREVNGVRFYEVGKIRYNRARIERVDNIWIQL